MFRSSLLRKFKNDSFLQKKAQNKIKKTFITICLIIFSTSYSLNAYAKDPYVTIGDKLQIGVPLTALLISLIKEDYVGSSEVIEGAIWTAAETHTLKALINRERPNKMDNDSFPSGHTSAAFQGAAFLQMRYGWAYGFPAYAAASFVGYSRVRGKYHYWSDVASGAALAIGSQYIITKMDYSLTNLWITPKINQDGAGLEFATTF